MTIITDQQKGSIEAMAEVLPKAVNFFCSYHCGKNILTNVKGGKGVYSAYWYYNQLLGCGQADTIAKLQFEHARNMDDKALAYVNSVNDHQQYPAARVAHGARFEGETIYMYQRSSSSTVESMNAANKLVRDWTAVDPINALILLLKLEAKRYADNKEQAWEWTEVLTPHGQKLCNNASSLLIRGTTPSALNRKNINMNALCRPTKQATRTNVGFHARTTMITPFSVDARVEFRT